MTKTSKPLPLAVSFLIVGAILAIPLFYHAPVPAVDDTLPPGASAKMPAGSRAYSTPLTIGAKEIHVMISDTEVEREQGLSNTEPLTSDEGMLFVYDAPQPVRFWMKDMRYPLDMIWIGADKTVVGVAKNATPESYPTTTFSPGVFVQYVLEVPAGFADENGITEGSVVVF